MNRELELLSETVPMLQPGDNLTQEEFLERWEAMPHLKRAELIQGVVYMPSPLSIEHGGKDFAVAGWLYVYAAATPGTRSRRRARTFSASSRSPTRSSDPSTLSTARPMMGAALESNF